MADSIGQEMTVLSAGMGVYEQRQSGTYMVRVRGAAGVFALGQTKRVAEVARAYGSGMVRITTRQDMQIHGVPTHSVAAALEALLEGGLVTKGAGGNSVRNVSACPLAGVCPREAFDVTPYALALSEQFMNEPDSFELPRKFKVAFSGCGQDCAFASVADVGFFAHVSGGVRGFAVYAGGGLGARSALAVKIEEFVPAEAVFEVADAVKRVFAKHGDRQNRSRARLRFVVERVGFEEFARLYREELAEARRGNADRPQVRADAARAASPAHTTEEEPGGERYARWKAANATPQKQHGLFTVRVTLADGEIAAEALAAVAGLAQEIRATQEQDLQLRNVPRASLPWVYRKLSEIDAELTAAHPVGCVACAGPALCRLGLCDSRALARDIRDALAGIEVGFASTVYISGCPNACGHHPTAGIGLYGCPKRVDGELTPHFTLVAGGRLREGDSRLAHPIGTLPAADVPGVLREFFETASAERRDGETYDELIERWGTEYLRRLICGGR